MQTSKSHKRKHIFAKFVGNKFHEFKILHTLRDSDNIDARITIFSGTLKNQLKFCTKFFQTTERQPRARTPSSRVGWKRLKHATNVSEKRGLDYFGRSI